MTRKRSVKLLMAEGYSRNNANRCALFVQFWRYSYQQFYNRIHQEDWFLTCNL